MTNFVEGQKCRVVKASFCGGVTPRSYKAGDIVEIVNSRPDSDGDLFILCPSGDYSYVHFAGLGPVDDHIGPFVEILEESK